MLVKINKKFLIFMIISVFLVLKYSRILHVITFYVQIQS